MKAISVIVPAYNASAYLVACLDSLMAQTFRDFEVVAINDGSKDDTLQILNSYKEKYPDFFVVLSQENQGLSVTRNNGVAAASGQYIFFLDSDDYIQPNTLEVLYKKAQKTGSDLICLNVHCVYPDKVLDVTSNVTFESSALTLAQKKQLFSMYPSAWSRLYKQELFTEKHLAFVPGVWFEDVVFTACMIPHLNSISYVDEYLYEYVQRPNSITYTYSTKLLDMHKILHKTLEYHQTHGFYQTYQDELEYMYARYMLATYLKRLSKAKDIKRFREGISFAFGEVKKNFPNYRKNPYIVNGGLKGLYLKYFNPLFAYAIYFLEKDRMN